MSTKPSREVVMAHVITLCTLPAQNAEDLGVSATDIKRTLADAIKKYAMNDAHIERACGVLMEENTFRPVWATIREAFERTRAGKTAPDCALCGNNRWIGGDYVVTYRGNGFDIASEYPVDFEEAHRIRPMLQANQDIISRAKPCVCRASLPRVA